jgi:hypothetical protein
MHARVATFEAETHHGRRLGRRGDSRPVRGREKDRRLEEARLRDVSDW